jgi:FtsP/CotA-like multicopper oxidase with cupredoxin domain
MMWPVVVGMALAILPVSLGRPGGHSQRNVPRIFDLTVTREKRAPNGFSREMILVNGQSPGPLLEMNEGDEVWVTVHNQMLDNTTMHFHGKSSKH